MRIKYTALEQQWKSINGHIQQRSNYIKQYMLDADGMMPALKSSLNSLARMVAALDAGLCNKVKDWLKILENISEIVTDSNLIFEWFSLPNVTVQLLVFQPITELGTEIQ